MEYRDKSEGENKNNKNRNWNWYSIELLQESNHHIISY